MSRTFDLSYLIGDLNPTRPVIWIISKNSSTFPEVNWGTELWACHHLSHDQAGLQTWSHSWSLDPPHKTWGTKKAYGPGLCCQSLRSKTRLTLGVQYNVDLRSCWFRRRWPAALPYVHSAHLFLKPNATQSIHPSTILCKSLTKQIYRNQPGIVGGKCRSWFLLDFRPGQGGPMVTVLTGMLACISPNVFGLCMKVLTYVTSLVGV